MALQTSGQISLSDVNTELGNAAGTSISMGGTAVRELFGIASGEIKMSNGYGASAASTPAALWYHDRYDDTDRVVPDDMPLYFITNGTRYGDGQTGTTILKAGIGIGNSNGKLALMLTTMWANTDSPKVWNTSTSSNYCYSAEIDNTDTTPHFGTSSTDMWSPLAYRSDGTTARDGTDYTFEDSGNDWSMRQESMSSPNGYGYIVSEINDDNTFSTMDKTYFLGGVTCIYGTSNRYGYKVRVQINSSQQITMTVGWDYFNESGCDGCGDENKPGTSGNDVNYTVSATWDATNYKFTGSGFEVNTGHIEDNYFGTSGVSYWTTSNTIYALYNNDSNYKRTYVSTGVNNQLVIHPRDGSDHLWIDAGAA